MVAVYDPDTLTRLCNIARAISIEWIRRFYDTGSFIMKFKLNDKYCQYLQKFNIVSHGGNYGIILKIEQTDIITVSGWDLKGFCKMRQVIPPFVYSSDPETIESYDRTKGNAESVMKHYASTQMVNCLGEEDGEDRKFEHLEIAEDKQRGVTMVWQAKFTPLDEELCKIGTYAKLGYDITFDSENKKFVFDVIEGSDRTSAQADLPPVVISYERGTCSDRKYTNDSTAEKNTIYAAGNGEEELQYVEKSAKKRIKGLRRLEGYISVGNAVIDEVGEAAAAQLEENIVKEFIEAEISKYKYKHDYFLGDSVTVIIDILGTRYSIDKQITEVNEYYEHGNTKITPTLGEKENTIKKLLRRINL